MNTQPLINELLKLRDSRPEYSGVVYDQDNFGSLDGSMIKTCIAGVGMFSQIGHKPFMDSILTAKAAKTDQHSQACMTATRQLLEIEPQWSCPAIFGGVVSCWPHELIERYRQAEHGICAHYMRINIAIEALSKMDEHGEFPSRAREVFPQAFRVAGGPERNIMPSLSDYTVQFYWTPTSSVQLRPGDRLRIADLGSGAVLPGTDLPDPQILAETYEAELRRAEAFQAEIRQFAQTNSLARNELVGSYA